MRTPAALSRPKPKPAQQGSFPATTAGWIANQNLANPTPGGAAALENFFPTATGLRVRAGSGSYATLVETDRPVTALFAYLNGDNERLFSANNSKIYDVTTVFFPQGLILGTGADALIVTDQGDELGSGSTDGLDVVTGLSGGDWITVQFASADKVFVVGVNGADDGILFDGSVFRRLSSTPTYSLGYDAGTAPFTVGATATGGTSGGAGTITRVDGATSSGTIELRNLTGPAFTDNEPLTDSAGGSATVNGTAQTIVGAFTGVPTSKLSFVWAFKQRLWFVEKGTLNAWYLQTGAITGAAAKFNLGGVFGRGGSLLFGATWSLDSGAQGGLSEQCIFVSTEGEVAVYQGTDPTNADSWSKVGVYRIGRPLGHNAFIRAGGDIAICTDIGLIPLSVAIQKDVAALSPNAVSYPIETAWNERVALRSSAPWHCELWPTQQMSVVALPTVTGSKPEMLVVNVRTGAWALYTGWDGTCLRTFKDRLFFGSQNGRVVEAGITGADQGKPYTSLVVPLFSDLGAPGTLKTAGTARAVLLSSFPVIERITMQSDFSLVVPPAPDAAPITSASVWGLGKWGQSKWGAGETKRPFQTWRSVSGIGAAMAPALQITSGSIPPPDIDLVRIDVTYTTGGIAT